MNLLSRIFKSKEKPRWEVLKVYSSLPVDLPSSIVRKHFVDSLLNIYKAHNGQMPSSFDIDGPYSIPKGKGVGIKRFKSLLQSKGYEKFYGLSMEDKYNEIRFEFHDTTQNLLEKGGSDGYREMIIAHKNPPYSMDLLQIALDLFEVFKFDYGYITQLPEDYNLLTESKITNALGLVISVELKDDLIWKSNTNRILIGDIKDLYPINLLNDQQVNKISAMNLNVKRFNDKLSLLTLQQDELRAIRRQLKNKLIINTPHTKR